MIRPLISVCIATYNGEKFIVEQLKTILSQLTDFDEIIISDDHSSDCTLSLIRSFRDPRIKIYLNLKSATKLFSVLLASKRPLITELADKLRLKYPLLPTISPCPTMRLEAIRSIIPISCRRYPKSV
ncbi:glycosyltransferase [Bacteroides fragilis]|nr:glycosyltransferase [Bacteroides fragilis]